MIREIAKYMYKYRWYAVLAPLCVAGEVLFEILIPRLMAAIVDVGIANTDLDYVLRTGGLMVLAAVCALILGLLAVRFSSKASMGFGAELRRGIFYKIQDFSFKNIDRFSVASLVTRLTADVSNCERASMLLMRMLTRSPVMLVSATLMAASINGELVWVFLVAIPVLAVALGLLITLSFPRFMRMLRKYDRMNATVQENLAAIRVVKSFVREGYEREKFDRATEELVDTSIQAEGIIVFNWPILNITMYSCIVAILWFGSQLTIGGQMLTGELLSFVGYVTQILTSLMMLSMGLIGIVTSKASLERIIEVLGEKVDITDEQADPALTVPDGGIEFRHVSFRYSGEAKEDTLKDINLSIRPGETIGIIGGTGSAKTTLVQLIPRLYEVSEGELRVGGHDVRDYTLDALRGAVSMVLQKNVLFSGTIEENLRWGDPNATHEQIVEAAKKAQADAFITSFPDGYNTVLGQGGVNLSGGQKQRLCIARALLAHPKILILDDSTSAVDTATDAKIREAFQHELGHVTTLIIAQRITSVMDADRIVVLDDGRIDGVGSHEELLRTNAIYRDVYESQQKGVA